MAEMLLCGAVGAQARLMSQALRKIAGNASKCNCTVIFLNQLRHKVLIHICNAFCSATRQSSECRGIFAVKHFKEGTDMYK